MGLTSDLRVLYNLAFTRVRGATHGERLEAFYRAQAGDYDAFRRRLLHGREEMMAALEIPEGGRMLDIGGGTGYNAELLGDRLARLQSLPSSICARRCWPPPTSASAATAGPTSTPSLADATTYEPEGGPVDVVTFSYSLTMIPNWFQALEQRLRRPQAGRHDRRRGFLHLAEVAGAGDAAALEFPAVLLADVVRPRQRLSLSGSSAMAAKPVPDGEAGGTPGQGALPAAEGAVLHLPGPQGVSELGWASTPRGRKELSPSACSA